MARNRIRSCIQAKACGWSGRLLLLHILGPFLAAAIVGGILYGPALGGGFVFDDTALPFRHGFQNAPLLAWLTGVRPVLMFSYWLNYGLSGDKPYTYHVVNLLIHAFNTGLVFAVLLRLLAVAGWQIRQCYTFAALCATVFLIHPLATESVSYIAGRSESLAALFMLLAYVVYLDGYPKPISWRRSIVVVMLFGVAVATKENAVALAAMLLLTDLFWKPSPIEGVRRNLRVYLLMTPGIALAGVWVARVLGGSKSAGFSYNGITWYQYAFTQARAIFVYIRLAVFPLGQSVDHDFAVSHTLTEYGAVFYLILLAAFVAAAIRFRRRYPLAGFGFLLFLILLAPTSSVIPIADTLVERRMYLPILGLILVACQLAKGIRWSIGPVTAVAVMVMVFGHLCYQRNQLWGKPEELWASAARESSRKGRPYLGLAESLIAVNRCADAIPYLERGERLMPREFAIQVAWGKVLECQGNREAALKRLELAATILPNSFVYQLIGLLEAELGRKGDAGVALQTAAQLGPGNSAAHSALGLWYESMGNPGEAEREYREALSLYPYSAEAQNGLTRVRRLSGDTTP